MAAEDEDDDRVTRLTPDEARDITHSMLGFYLQQRGVDTRKNFTCPFHHDTHPSMRYYSSDQKAYCPSCHRQYDIFDFFAIDNGLVQSGDELTPGNRDVYRTAMRLAYQWSGVWPDTDFGSYDASKPRTAASASATATDSSGMQTASYTQRRRVTRPKQDFTTYYSSLKPLAECSGALDYWQSRGFDEADAEQHHVMYDADRYRIVLPVSSSFYTTRGIIDDSSFRYMNAKGAPVELYGLDALALPQSVYVVEGILDAYSIEKTGGRAVALHGTDHMSKLVAYLREHPDDVKAWIWLALDSDGPGRECSAALTESLVELGYHDEDDHPPEARLCSDDCKDANEMLVEHPEKLASKVALFNQIGARYLEHFGTNRVGRKKN